MTELNQSQIIIDRQKILISILLMSIFRDLYKYCILIKLNSYPYDDIYHNRYYHYN